MTQSAATETITEVRTRSAVWMHYSDVRALVAEDRVQGERGSRRARGDKPEGLWISDESADDGWSSWASGEDYTIGSNAFVVELAPDASILSLTSEAAILDFHRTYSIGERGWDVDWTAVAQRWQGITITPYQWGLRLSQVSWYYTWDCASGCIWDAKAISTIRPVAASSSSSRTEQESEQQ